MRLTDCRGSALMSHGDPASAWCSPPVQPRLRSSSPLFNGNSGLCVKIFPGSNDCSSPASPDSAASHFLYVRSSSLAFAGVPEGSHFGRFMSHLRPRKQAWCAKTGRCHPLLRNLLISHKSVRLKSKTLIKLNRNKSQRLCLMVCVWDV